MAILIITLIIVFIGLWYSGLYYNCSYFKKARAIEFVKLKELLNERCELMTVLADGIGRTDVKELCEKALAESNIESRVAIENLLTKAFVELQSQEGIVVEEALSLVEAQLKDMVKSYNECTDTYNRVVANFLIRVTARIAELSPAEKLQF